MPENSIEVDLQRAEEQRLEKETHFGELAARMTTRAKAKKLDLPPKSGQMSESQEKVVTSSPIEGFTEEEHSKMLRAAERLRHKRYPLMIKSNYGASLLSESGLTSDRIRSWLHVVGYKPRIIELSGLEVWEDGSGIDAKKDVPTCGSCPVALNGDKSIIWCDPCRYLARSVIRRNSLRAVEVSPLVHQSQSAVIVEGST